MICSSESSKECVKVSHVIVEYRVINHHLITSAFAKPPRSEFQSRAPNDNDFCVKNIKVGENSPIALYTRYSIVARALGVAFRPSARASKGILHTTHSGAYCFCMQYTFARARSRQAKRARDDRVSCIQPFVTPLLHTRVTVH